MKLQFMKIRKKEAVGGSNKIHQLENNFHKILTNIFEPLPFVRECDRHFDRLSTIRQHCARLHGAYMRIE